MAYRRLLLSEGQAGAFFPETTYVRQKDKVFYFMGKKSLFESTNSPGTTIVESLDKLELCERKNQDGSVSKVVKDGQWFFEGPFQRSDVKNANQRTYPRKIWERLIADDKSPVQELCKARGMLGHLEHPKDGRTDANEGAFVVTELKLLNEKGENDGVVWGKGELLDTPKGQILQEYTRKNVRWGVSSRGNGSVDDKGIVNENDFMVETWDAVMRPSTPGAYASPLNTSEGGEEGNTRSTNEGVDSVSMMTEGVKAWLADAAKLADSPVEGLVESERLTHLQAMMTHFGKLGTTATVSGDSQFKNIFGALCKRMETVYEAVLEGVLDRKINESLAEGEESGKDERAFNQAIGELQVRLEESAEESEELRNGLNIADSELKTMTAERDKALKGLSEAKTEIRKLKSEKEIATSVIESLTATAQNSVQVCEAVDKAIGEVPGLLKYKPRLLEASTVEQVAQLAESFIPAVVAHKEPSRAATTMLSNRQFPTGRVQSDLVPVALNESAAPVSRSVALAGAAAKKMQKNG